MFPVSDECITVSDEFSKKKKKKSCFSLSVLHAISLFFSLSRLSSCSAAAVRTRCTRLQCADLHSLPPIGSRISCCHFFLWTCIIVAAPLDQTLDNLLGTTISQKLSTTTPPLSPRPYSIMSRTLAQRHVEWCNILYIPHIKSVLIKLYSLTRH